MKDGAPCSAKNAICAQPEFTTPGWPSHCNWYDEVVVVVVVVVYQTVSTRLAGAANPASGPRLCLGVAFRGAGTDYSGGYYRARCARFGAESTPRMAGGIRGGHAAFTKIPAKEKTARERHNVVPIESKSGSTARRCAQGHWRGDSLWARNSRVPCSRGGIQ